MYQIKILICDCCGRVFKRGSNLFLEDQKHFFNKYHRLRYKPLSGYREFTIEEAREKKYNQPGCGNIEPRKIKATKPY
jgi:hypothetical protein